MVRKELLAQSKALAFEQVAATAIALSKIGVEMHALMADADAQTPLALAAHVKRAALAVSSLASLVGQVDLLARLGAP